MLSSVFDGLYDTAKGGGQEGNKVGVRKRIITHKHIQSYKNYNVILLLMYDPILVQSTKYNHVCVN